jgi:hypothetical protein
MAAIWHEPAFDIRNQPTRAFQRARRIGDDFVFADEQQRRHRHRAQRLISTAVAKQAANAMNSLDESISRTCAAERRAWMNRCGCRYSGAERTSAAGISAVAIGFFRVKARRATGLRRTSSTGSCDRWVSSREILATWPSVAHRASATAAMSSVAARNDVL